MPPRIEFISSNRPSYCLSVLLILIIDSQEVVNEPVFFIGHSEEEYVTHDSEDSYTRTHLTRRHIGGGILQAYNEYNLIVQIGRSYSTVDGGDSGGVLLSEDLQTILGVTSYVDREDYPLPFGFPSAYFTRVDAVADFIDDFVDID